MKHYPIWFRSGLGVAIGLAAATAALAQGTTVLTDFHNFNLSVTYANWNVDGSSTFNGGTGFTPVITSGASGYEVQAQGYGSGAYNFPTPISAPGATEWQLTFTIVTPSSTSGVFWMNPGLDMSDGTHQVHLTAANTEGAYLNYGNFTAGTYTLHGAFKDQFGGADLDTTTITAFNLEFDPAGYGTGAPYDIIYQNLSVVAPVPEPSSLALLGLGAGALAFARRRARVS